MWPLWRLLFFDKNNGDKLSTNSPEKDLMDLLVDRTISAGHMLSFKEASEDPEMVKPNSYAFYFGSFSDAARTAWYKAKANLTKLSVISSRSLEEFTHKGGETMSEIQQKKHKGKGSRYTIEEVKKVLVNFYERTGRLPTQDDAREYDSGLPSWNTLIKFLGPKTGWADIVGTRNIDQATEAKSLNPTDENVAKEDRSAANVGPETSNTMAMEKPKVGDASLVEDDFEEASEGYGRNTNSEKPLLKKAKKPQPREDSIKVETLHEEQNNLVTVDIKITLPGKKKPVFITLTV